MAKLTKKAKAIKEKVSSSKQYSISEAVGLLKEFANTKFDESIDISVNLGVDPRKSDQNVRGASVLPNGTGKTVRVAVFAQGPGADAAKEAGADIVGMDDLADQVKKGEMNFDVVIASPDAMRVVGQLGQILGPKVSFDEASIKQNLEFLVSDLKKAKPTAAKGVYLKKISLSSTMGPGLWIDQSSLEI